MDYMNWAETLRISGGLLAAGSGFVAYCSAVIAQAAPSLPEITNPSSALATGAVYTGGAGLLLAGSTFISSIIKPYWDDRQRARESEERRLRMQYGLTRNNQITLKHQRWIEAAHKLNPQLPEPPTWIALYEDSAIGGDKTP